MSIYYRRIYEDLMGRVERGRWLVYLEAKMREYWWRRRLRELERIVYNLRRPRLLIHLIEAEEALREPWYYRLVHYRFPRLWTILRILDRILSRAFRARILPRFILFFANIMVWRYRLRRWGYREWTAYRLELLGLWFRLYNYLVEKIYTYCRDIVLPLFRVYTGMGFSYFEHEWEGEFWYRLTPVHREIVAREVLQATFGRRRPYYLQQFSPEALAILEYAAYRMGITDRPGMIGGILVLPWFIEDFEGRPCVYFYGLVIPRKYIEPDPWVGALANVPLHDFSYRWKWEMEDVPIDSIYREDPTELVPLFDELANALFEDDWFLAYSNPSLLKSFLMASIGLPENWWKALTMASFVVRRRRWFREGFPLTRRGNYYWARDILFYLGFRW